jgi:hypothetical protein
MDSMDEMDGVDIVDGEPRDYLYIARRYFTKAGYFLEFIEGGVCHEAVLREELVEIFLRIGD